jgi:sugar (pentulose or hexulose) kinase
MSAQAFLLGLDIGTTNLKCIIVNDLLEVVAFAESEYNITTPERGRAEQDPNEWWVVLGKVVREALKNLDEKSIKEIVGISISSQGGTLVPVDENGQALYPAILWLDQRSKVQTDRLETEYGIDYFYLKTGWKLNAGLPLPKILWLRENEPEIFQKTFKFLNTSDYIVYKLTGKYLIDSSSACITMLYNLIKKQWDEDILSMIGISKEKLSEIVSPGEKVGNLTNEASKNLGLPKGIPIYAGGHDQFCVALGTGVINPGEVLLSGGTAWVLVSITDRIVFDTQNYLALEEHVIPERWGILSSIPAGGASMKWLKEILNREYKEIDEGVKDIMSKYNSLLFFPYLTGAGAPHWNLDYLGTILGLRLEHNYRDIARSLMEGVGFEVLWTLGILKSLGLEPKDLRIVGGCTKSPIWPQIIANITGIDIIIPKISECGALGASILAGLGSGIFSSLEDIPNLGEPRLLIPADRNRTNEYLHLFSYYKSVFDSLSRLYKEIFKNLEKGGNYAEPS